MDCSGIPALLGHVIGITGDRRVEELTAHLRALGANVLHGPMLHTKPISDDDSQLREATVAIITRPPAYLVATTGIGIRSWMNAAARWGVRDQLLESLSRTRILARGPKVAGAVIEAGLLVWSTDPVGRTMAMLDELPAAALSGAHIAVQLPGDAMVDVVRRLHLVGADVTPIVVYDWTWPDDLRPPRRLLRAVVERRVSAVTFTSRPAVRNFLALADGDGMLADVRDAFRESVLPVCVGAVTADALRTATGAEPAEPERPLLGMMVQTVADEVRQREHRHVRTPTGDHVVVQGRLVEGLGNAVTMSDREAALLSRLLATPKRTIARDALLQDVWRDEVVDPSVLETTMARVRRRLTKTGLTILTISGRGYLLNGEVVPCTNPPSNDPLPRLAVAG
jgi:uroporphyrinogen-III synthase